MVIKFHLAVAIGFFFNKFDSIFDSLTKIFRWLYVNIRRKPSRTTHHDEGKTFVY